MMGANNRCPAQHVPLVGGLSKKKKDIAHYIVCDLYIFVWVRLRHLSDPLLCSTGTGQLGPHAYLKSRQTDESLRQKAFSNGDVVSFTAYRVPCPHAVGLVGS